MIDVRQDIREFTEELARLMRVFEKRLKKALEGGKNDRRIRKYEAS